MGNLLSFCIPTFNRAGVLKCVIEKLIPVCEKFDLQICVSDNASPDNTNSIMQELVTIYPFIKYYRHPINIGPDDNFEYVLKMADTKYRWLMSDTCYVLDIDNVIDDLKHNEWDAYVLGGDKKSKYRPQNRIIYNDSISVMNDLGRHLSWISCMIYNEKLILSMPFVRYKKSSFNQTALIFEPTAGRDCHICFDPDTIVYAMPILKESAWQWHVFDIFYRQWWNMIMSLPIYYPYEIKAKAVRSTGGVNTLRFHLKRRGEGKWTFNDFWRNRFFIRQCGNDFYTLFLIGITPIPVIQLMRNLGHLIKEILSICKVKQ